MATATSTHVEETIRALCADGSADQATTEALRAYGGEVFRLLRVLQKSDDAASDAFSLFAEDLWRSMRTFAWQCSLRTWAYTLARRASSRASRRRRRDAKNLTSTPHLSEIVEAVRTETLTFLRTEKRNRLRALRDSLPEDDRALLVLRVDRGLAWDELARILADGDLDEEGRKREAARLRKRFQLVKDRLKALAKEQGIYPGPREG
jgi:RNA polymerase sigma-70 factor (ECF subfamily)